MALNSINSNAAPLIALQNLNVTNQTLQDTQNRISTGQKVSSDKDNGAIYAIAQNLRAQNSAFDAVKDSLNRGVSTVDVALSAGNSISSALSKRKRLPMTRSNTVGGKALEIIAKKFLNYCLPAETHSLAKEASNLTGNGLLYSTLGGRRRK